MSSILDISGQEEVYVYETVMQCKDIHVFINDYIEDLSFFRPLHKILMEASENDSVTFHMSCPGGWIYTALTISNWIKSTNASTMAILEGENASASGIIILACDGVAVHDHSVLMCHSSQFGYSGLQDHVRGYVDFADKQLRNIAEDVYKGFLTEEEIDSITIGSKEIWMDSDEIIKRLERREELRERESENECGECEGDEE